MRSPTDRRSFLKLLSFLPLMPLLGECSHSVENVTQPAESRDTPNVLILVFDAFSSRHASLYGYRRETTPNLARFAERSTVFHRHYAAGNFTTPGTASLLTGVYPWSHRALDFLGKFTNSYRKMNIFSLFSAAQYWTFAYTHNPLVSILLHQSRQGLDLLKKMGDLCLMGQHVSDQVFWRDFDIAIQSEWLFRRENHSNAPSSLFLSLLERALRHGFSASSRSDELKPRFPKGVQTTFGHFGGLPFILEHATDWIGSQLSTSPQPFLGYVHLYPPHEPYHPRREFINIFDDGWVPPAKPPHYFALGNSSKQLRGLRREYDEHLAYSDAEFGRLCDLMERNGTRDTTYVIVTSDHGQMFERGIHGHWTETLYEPVMRVPLLISAPGQRRRKDVHTPTSCVDLLPTLLHATGQAIPDWSEGEILPTFGQEETGAGRSIYCMEAKSNLKQDPLTKATVALIQDEHKLIHYFGYDGYENEFELYDIANDPEEMEDLYPSQEGIATRLRDEMEEDLRRAHARYLEKDDRS
jgi:arylsulfatase A-like enzyme